jgi:hypothetical protein
VVFLWSFCGEMRGKDGLLMVTFHGRKKINYFELYFLLTDSDLRGDALLTVFPGTLPGPGEPRDGSIADMAASNVTLSSFRLRKRS